MSGVVVYRSDTNNKHLLCFGYSIPGFVRFDIKLVEWLRKFEMCVFVIEIFVVVPYYCEYYYCVFTTL